VLSADGGPAGTCFHAAPGVLVTSWRVLVEAGPGVEVRVESLTPGGGTATARVVRADPVHDLAVLAMSDGVFDAMVDGFAPTGDQEAALPVLSGRFPHP
jgi:hypothetical protein